MEGLIIDIPWKDRSCEHVGGATDHKPYHWPSADKGDGDLHVQTPKAGLSSADHNPALSQCDRKKRPSRRQH